MKIVIDLTKLVAEGRLTPALAEELQGMAAHDTGLLGINILMAFGVFAVGAGVVALLPTYPTAVALGLGLAAAGVTVSLVIGPQWALLGAASTIAGALTFAGGVVGLTEGHWTGFALTVALFVALTVAIRSGLLSALTVLALAGLLGSSTGYASAVYFLEVDEPTATIVVFGLLAWAAYFSLRLVPASCERICLSFSRVSLFMVNFGFWVGSLWGDRPGQSWDRAQTSIHIPDYAFAVLWALALAGVGIWAVRANRRFVVNTVAAFGAIHFSTQWFERLGAEPLSVMAGGVLIVAVAAALWRYNAASRRARA
jgi:iron complex transport system permease protein